MCNHIHYYIYEKLIPMTKTSHPTNLEVVYLSMVFNKLSKFMNQPCMNNLSFCKESMT